MKEIVIKKYAQVYFDDLSELGVNFLNLHNEKSVEIQLFRENWKPYIEKICKDKNYLIILAQNKQNEKIVAYAISQYDNKGRNLNCIILNEIFVSEPFQNKGIGGKLLEEVASWGKKLGAKEIVLKVRASNKKALDFYIGADFSIYNHILKRRL